MYAIDHPRRVKSLLLWSVYLIRQFDDDWGNSGYPRYYFPCEWARFIALVPKTHRTSGTTILQYYAAKMRSPDKQEAKRYTVEWLLWENALVSIRYDPNQNINDVTSDPNTLAIALLETHYFMNGCFVPRNYILDNLKKITHIPCNIVQGRFDMCTPPIIAYDLAQAYGKNLTLQWVNSGHLRTNPELFSKLKEVAATKVI